MGLSFGFLLYLYSCIFIVGICIGSFLNVVIYRLPAGLSVVKPRSRCWKCKTQIAWYDNIPLVSWLVLKGACRVCKTPISIRYFLVELLVGLLYCFSFYCFGISIEFVLVALLVPAYVSTALIDLDTWTIRIEILAYMAALALGVATLAGILDRDVTRMLHVSVYDGQWIHIIMVPVSFVIAFLLLNAVRVAATWYFQKTGRLEQDEEAMGLGDPLLLGVMAAISGLSSIPVMLFLAALQGSVVGIILALKGRLGPNGHQTNLDDDWVPPDTALPFGPYLALAGLEILFCGEAIIRFLPSFFFAA